eukprot:m.42983 g.42983  ORF g.42983 m.42983 type:complete len:90 (-) comp10753_c0_seq2:72-341(-)
MFTTCMTANTHPTPVEFIVEMETTPRSLSCRVYTTATTECLSPTPCFVCMCMFRCVCYSLEKCSTFLRNIGTMSEAFLSAFQLAFGGVD